MAKFKRGDRVWVTDKSHNHFGKILEVRENDNPFPWCRTKAGKMLGVDETDLELVGEQVGIHRLGLVVTDEDEIEFENIFKAIGFVEANPGWEFSWGSGRRWYRSFTDIPLGLLRDLPNMSSPYLARKIKKTSKKMTVKQICEALGEDIEIVKGDE